MVESEGLLVQVFRRWWVVLLVTALVIAAAAWYASGQQASYQTTQIIAVSASTNLDQTAALRASDLLTDERTAPTIADVLASPRVVNPARESVQLGGEVGDDYRVVVSTEPDSNALRMTVTGPRAERVRQLSAAVVAEGEGVVTQTYPLFAIQSLESGDPTVERVDLSWERLMVLAAVVGLGLGVIAACWVDALLRYRAAARRRSLAATAGSGTLELPVTGASVDEPHRGTPEQ